MPRRAAPILSQPSLGHEDWQQIWGMIKDLCERTQITNPSLLSVTARPNEIFGDDLTFAKYKDDTQKRKQNRDIGTFSSFVSISDVDRSQNTELRIQWEAYLLHLNDDESESGERSTRARARAYRSLSSGPSGFWVLINMDRVDQRVYERRGIVCRGLGFRAKRGAKRVILGC